jgi:hypothetical protein
MSIRFLPKRRASIDWTPGPSIASAAPRVANTMQLRTSPVLEAMDHSSTITTKTPVMGVHKPATKSIPAAISRTGRTMPDHCDVRSSSIAPSLIKKKAATNRRSRRPLPGHPVGNIGKSRCTETSTTSLGVPQRWPNLQKLASPYPPLEGSQFDDSPFQHDGHRVRSVVGA